MLRSSLLVWIVCSIASSRPASAEQVPVRHVQHPMHRFLVARSVQGTVLARGEFTQVVQGDEVSMRMSYRFADGSTDEETTTYRQQGTFRLVRNHHIQKGPFFARPVDFAVDTTTAAATTRTVDVDGNIHAEQQHLQLPDDLANGFVGTVLLNTPPRTPPFRVGMLAPVGGGRPIRLLISPDREQEFHLDGQTLTAAVFRVHPELGGMVGVIARLIGLQPRDVLVWVQEGDVPAVVRIVGQLGGYGPVVSSELEGASFAR